jgi:hypothetical protein
MTTCLNQHRPTNPLSTSYASSCAVNDSRYRWLEAAPAIWAGEFDAVSATARYRGYLPAGPLNDEL